MTWRHPTHILAIDVQRNGPQECWHIRSSDRINALIYAHTTSRTLPTCDISLDSLTVIIPEAGDFMEALEL